MSLENTTVTLTIERINSLGLGVGVHEGTEIAVPFVLVGEVTRVRILGQQGKTKLAELLAVLTPSKERVSPVCAVFGRCGGCQLQHMTYAEQLRLKLSWLKSALREFAAVKIHDVVASEQAYAYRSRITLHHNRKEFGYYAAGSHALVPISTCPIATDAVNEHLNKELFKHASPVEVRADGINEEAFFAQVNLGQNEKLIRIVSELATPTSRSHEILELFAGAGNLTFALAQRAKRVLAIESNAAACAALQKRRQQEANGRKITVKCAPAEDAVFELVRDCENFAVIVCDPPRDGLRGVINRLDKLAAEKIVYVSCQPVSFARDARLLAAKGYLLQEVTPIDMFPQTVHLEIVAVFCRS